jgi:hypothetical protein
MAANDRSVAVAKKAATRSAKSLKTAEVALRLAVESLKVARKLVDDARKEHADAKAALEEAEERSKAACRKWEVVDLSEEVDDRPWYRDF